MRSFATRGAKGEIATAVADAIRVCRLAGFDWILVETSGHRAGATPRSWTSRDVSVYVMTPEYGAASQLEKIGMLDYADLVAVNKVDRRGGEDALRDVRKQVQRNRKAFDADPEGLGVFGTVASRFCDPGVDAFFEALVARAAAVGRARAGDPPAAHDAGRGPGDRRGVGRRSRPTASATSREIVRSGPRVPGVGRGAGPPRAGRRPAWRERWRWWTRRRRPPAVAEALARAVRRLDPRARELLESWPALVKALRGRRDRVRGPGPQAVERRPSTARLAGHADPEGGPAAHPGARGDPPLPPPREPPRPLPVHRGRVPVQAHRTRTRSASSPGEGPPDRTNRRFHFLTRNAPEQAPLHGVRLRHPLRRGPRPPPRHLREGRGERGLHLHPRRREDPLRRLRPLRPEHLGVHDHQRAGADDARHVPERRHRPAGGHFVRQKGRAPTPEEQAGIRAWTLRTVRGTVQADILKEDQAQNTCIFSTPFALKMMGDIQEYFIEHEVRNYYSVSISGYHIAEAGANPITQLAFTLSNGFTFVEYYLARGMKIDDFAPNLSFFFSNGLDPEYTVIGRVARRIWAVAMRDRYGGNERSQKLKYHIQTSGRSLHAQEIQFNDIRTTLQALLALQDNCNSLHTNAYDEAITTPTEESVRRAMAIQLICGEGVRLAQEREPAPGLVLRAAADRRGGGGGARRSSSGSTTAAACWAPWRPSTSAGRIQEESLLYERQEAQRRAADRRGEHLPPGAAREDLTSRVVRALPRHAGGEEAPARPPPGLPAPRHREAARGARAAEGGRARRRERLRRAAWRPSAWPRSARSPTRSTRSAGSTAGTCDRVGPAEVAGPPGVAGEGPPEGDGGDTGEGSRGHRGAQGRDRT